MSASPVVPYAKRLAYCAKARNIGRRWRGYLYLLGAVVVLVAVAVASRDWTGKQFVLGFGVGACVVATALRSRRPAVTGRDAETFPVEALRRARAWTVVDDLPVGEVDVDLVVVTPAGVLAVETVWHGPSATPELDRRRAVRGRNAASTGARRLRLLLRSYGLDEGVTVTPVLMAWGPGAPDLAEGFRVVDGVYVVDGDHPYLWRHRFSAPLLTADRRAQVADTLRDHAQRAGQPAQPLRQQLLAEFRSGVVAERRQRVARETLRRVSRQRHDRPTLTG